VPSTRSPRAHHRVNPYPGNLLVIVAELLPYPAMYVVDGGYLLRKVRWCKAVAST